jgi:hypothetical protein
MIEAVFACFIVAASVMFFIYAASLIFNYFWMRYQIRKIELE